MPISWNRFAQDIIKKQHEQQQPKYCTKCGKPFIRIRAVKPEHKAVRERQYQYGLCWECAGGTDD